LTFTIALGKVETTCRTVMARYRIVQRPSRAFLGSHAYDIEERFIFWWDPISPSWLSLETAEQALDDIKKSKAMDCRPKVIKEYN
jgi:hypothetical protein